MYYIKKAPVTFIKKTIVISQKTSKLIFQIFSVTKAIFISL